MQRSIIIAVVVSVCVGAALAALLYSSTQRNHTLDAELSNTHRALTNAQAVAERTREATELLQRNVAALSEVLSNSTDWLRADALSAQHGRENENRQQPAQPVAASTEARTLPQVRIYAVVQWGGASPKFRTDKGEIFINGIPPGINAYLDKIEKTKETIRQLTAKLEADDQDARRANAVALTSAGGNAAYVDAAMAERRRANLMMENVKDQQINLEKWKDHLRGGEAIMDPMTLILAYDTARGYAGAQIWQFVRMARHGPR